MNTTEISPVLEEIKNSTNLITKYLDESEKEKYKEIFYNLLLYYTMNYESTKLNKLFEDKNANKYFQKILYTFKESFKGINLPNSFIDEMIQSGFEMDYEKFIVTLNYLKSLEIF